MVKFSTHLVQKPLWDFPHRKGLLMGKSEELCVKPMVDLSVLSPSQSPHPPKKNDKKTKLSVDESESGQ